VPMAMVISALVNGTMSAGPIMSTAMTVGRLSVTCLPSARQVAAASWVVVRASASDVPYVTPATRM
jgi:hypothetical protein